MRTSKFCILLLAAATSGTSVLLAEDLAIRGELVYTMSGAPVHDGVVLLKDGKVERVGPASQVQIPAGRRTLSAKVVTPGLVDAHSVVGLSGYLNQPHDQDQLEKSAAIQPELRAIDAYNARETLVGWLRGFGVTTIHTGHGPGELVSGQTMVAKTTGSEVDDAVIDPMTMIAVTLGEGAFMDKGKSPGTRAKEIAMLRADLIRAQEYKAKQAGAADDKKPARDLRLDAWVSVLDRKTPLLVTANRSQDIVSALRLAKEFNIRIVLDGAAESYLVIDQIKAAGVPVIVHATMARALGESQNASFDTAAKLKKAGILVALQSGYEAYVPKTRVVLFEAAVAAANGLSAEEALATITIDAAKIIGLDKRVGSLEAGKDGDVVLYDGDPFEYTSHVVDVVIDGKVVSEEKK